MSIYGFYLIIIIFCLLFAWLSWRRRDLAVALVIFALPSYLIRFKVFSIPTTMLEVMILVLFAVFLVTNGTRIAPLSFRSRIEKFIKGTLHRFLHAGRNDSGSVGGYCWGILLFILFATISVFAAPDKMAALGIWKAYFIEPILFFIVFINTIKTKEHFNLVINAIAASALLVALPAIFQKFTGFGFTTVSFFNEATRRVTSWYGFPNAVGLYLAPIVVLFAGLIIVGWIKGSTKLEAQNPNKITNLKFKFQSQLAIKFKREDAKQLIFCFLVFLLSLLAIYYAKSEGALIGSAVGIVFLIFVLTGKKIRLMAAIILIIIITSISLNAATANYFKSKLTLSDLSGQIRLQQWKETWTMLKNDKILFGAGLSGYKTAVAPYHQAGIWLNDKSDLNWLKKIQTDEKFRQSHWQPTEIYQYPHNLILNFWSETGLFGLLTFVLLLGIFLMDYWRVKEVGNKKMYLVLIGVMITILIHGLVDVPYFKNDLSVWWWMVFGMATVIAGRDINES